jgi:hypothetical protein
MKAGTEAGFRSVCSKGERAGCHACVLLIRLGDDYDPQG